MPAPLSVQSPRWIRAWGKEITLDSLFVVPPMFYSNGVGNPYEDRWIVWTYNNPTNMSMILSNGSIRVSGTKPDNGDLRLTTPAYYLDRRMQYRISYQIRINQTVNGSQGNLNTSGLVSGAAIYSGQTLEAYRVKTINNSDGWQYREYVVPSYAFQGDHIDSNNRIGWVRFVMIFSWTGTGTLDYEFKDFRIWSEKVLSSPRSVLNKRSS